MQIMYERRLTEYEVCWLRGYEDAAPVRIGNAAAGQLQLDVYGEVLDALYQARRMGLTPNEAAWNLERALLEHLENIWDLPDEGLWEVRGGRRQFTHSKVMAWVAFDRAIKSAEMFGLDGPIDHWRDVRDRIHADVCTKAFNPSVNAFVQSYGSTLADASVLLIPLVGFLPPDDPRVRGTVEFVEKHLLVDGFVLRYDSAATDDGLPEGEGAFLACSFWLADNYILLGRRADAVRMFERLLSLRNDVGLLSEEYDPRLRRQAGNFPQAFSHIALLSTAFNLGHIDHEQTPRPAEQRRDGAMSP
jgi:GH15 family glucan-1,4-alpha-glucosidase